MTELEFGMLIRRGHEVPGVEFKGPGLRTGKLFFAWITRAVLGMANRRDGGLVIIGVEDSGPGGLDPVGLSAAQLATWSYDDIAAGLAPYVDPAVEFERAIVQYDTKTFVVLRVAEFDDIPILCKRGYQESVPGKRHREVLREGACYVRRRGKPETTEIPSHQEMRELIELATEKRLRRFLATAERLGLLPSPSMKGPSDEEKFDDQLRTLK